MVAQLNDTKVAAAALQLQLCSVLSGRRVLFVLLLEDS